MDEAAQRARVEGHGNIVVQVTGDGNVLNLRRDLPALWLDTFASPLFSQVTEGGASEPGFTATGKLETDLLTPYTRALTLVGRRSFLDRLHAWLNDPAPISVTAVIGGGGRGKTRVALELCREAACRGWLAGFVTRDELARFRGQTAVATWGWPKPTLVVVDYAAAKAEALRGWLADLTRHATAWTVPRHPPLRLLLLERHGERGSGWMARMVGDGDAASRAARLLHRDAPLMLGVLESPGDRRAVFFEAYRLARGEDLPDLADLARLLAEQSAGGEPLLLAMSGLYAARRGVAGALAETADTLALAIARGELARIRRVWSARGLPVVEDTPLPDHLAAVATLRGGLTAEDAHAVIAKEAAALHQAEAAPAGSTERVRAALCEALRAEGGGIAPILPDLIGGAALIAAWGGRAQGVAAVRRAARAAPAAVTATVIRACQDFLIRGQRAPLAWLEGVRTEIGDLEGLMALADAMPSATVELRETALAVTEAIVAQLRRLDPNAAVVAVLLALSLNNLSGRLADLGRREAALAAIEEAVAIRRTLAQARPDAFLPDLATSLNNLSNSLGDLGRREAALAAIEEAVAIRRTLAQTRPDAFLPNLALALNNLSGRLADLGRREAALAAIEEAVAHNRTLAQARPDAFLPDLAMSLSNLSVRLADLGRREAALAAIKEAVAHYRTLAQARPDAFLPDLAGSLNNLSGCLADLGRREAALAAIEEAVAHYRTLAQTRPDAFLPNLATSLGARGAILREADPASAAASIRGGIEMLRSPFLALPPAFASLMLALAQGYVDACEAAGLAIDQDLLAPIVEALHRLQTDQPPEPPP